MSTPLQRLRHHVSGAIERGESAAIAEVRAIPQTAKRYADTAVTPSGVNLQLIGYWSDLAAYYEGDDGNAWSYGVGARITCCGPIDSFREHFAQRYRGELFA